MELPNLGQHCSHKDCKQLDFLPLQCKCGKLFCSIHLNIHVEVCESCITLQAEPQKISNVYTCAHVGCNDTSLIEMLCQKCHTHFCVKHRHLTQCHEKSAETIAQEKEKIAAPIRQFNEAKLVVDKQVEQNLLEAKKKAKKSNLANKVQLMKIKNKAKGLNTIPTTDRLYFSVSYLGHQQDVPLFVSKLWSVGRAIDAIANELKLQNDNNKSSCKKLRLFKKESGAIVTVNVAEILDELIAKSVIIDGENLVIEYVNDNCQFLSGDD
ncbi:AN1-type zinc finger protein 1-like [Zophobas morio]|uniref:AN1-type zinc finger protein 1-like n=1 Tax=Zophobas morio TaxID=2755281 RepID=UPI00308314A3